MASPIVLKPRVLVETPHMIAVYKPPGLNFHSLSTVQPGLLQQLRDAQASGAMPGGYLGRLWPVHRLDTVTSGIVLFAKSAPAASYLAECFKRKAIIKYYIALSDRKPSKKMGTIKGDMARSRRASWMLLRTANEPAITRFESFPLDMPSSTPATASTCVQAPLPPHPWLITRHQPHVNEGQQCVPDGEGVSRSGRLVAQQQRETAKADNKMYRGGKTITTDGSSSSGSSSSTSSSAMRIYVLRPETGRTHQLRVAMKSNGVPILGDALYANAADAAVQDRAYLHAAALRVHIGGQRVSIICPPDSGELFTSEPFQQLFQDVVTDRCQADSDVWFPDNPVLRSVLHSQPAAELAELWDKRTSLSLPEQMSSSSTECSKDAELVALPTA